MIHILHPQTDAIVGYLDNNGDHVFWLDEHEQHVDGFNIFQFTMDSQDLESVNVEGRARVLIPSEYGGYQEFIIHEVTTIKHKKVVAIGAEVELDKQKIIVPAKHEGLTLKQYAMLATADTEYEVGNIEYSGAQTLTFDKHLGAYSFSKQVANAFDVEVSFRVEVKGNKIIGRYMDMIERIGVYEGKEIEYGKDLIGIEKKTYTERIVTALFCLGPVKEDGTRLTTTVTDADAFQRWGRDGKHILGKYEPESDNQDMTLAELQQYGQTELKKRIDSIDEYMVEAATIESIYPNERVRLGDSVRIKNTKYQPPLYADARILSVKRSLTDPSRKSFVIGNVVTYKEEDILKTFKQLQNIYGLRVVKSVSAPVGNSNVIWIKTDPESSFEIAHTWDGTEWIPITPTTPEEIGAESPEGAQSKSIEKYLNVINAEKADIDTRYNSIYSNADLIGTPKTNLANAKNAYDTGYTDLVNAINLAKADGETTGVEKDNVDSKYSFYRGYLSVLSARFEEVTRSIETKKADDAETAAKDHADNKAAEAVEEANDFTQSYANKKIVQSSSAPSSPAIGDLWIDTSATPYVWKRYTGTVWANASATSLEELDGVLQTAQIAVGAIDTSKLADNAITVQKILDGAIAEAKLANNSVSVNKILDGAIETGKLAANSVTASKIAVSSPNMLYDVDSFEQYAGKQPPGSSGLSTSIVTDEQAYHGRYSLKHVSTGESSYKYLNPISNDSTAWVRLEAGKRYVVSAYVKTTSSTPTSVQLVAVTRNFGTTTGVAGGSNSTISISSSDGWKRISFMTGAIGGGTPPAMTLYVRNMSSGITTYWDAFQVEEYNGLDSAPSAFSPGGSVVLDGGNLVANSVTASQIAALTITASELASGSIIAGKIAADAVTATTIATGAVTADAIAAGSITSTMITTAGLDAAVIKFGTMNGDRILANTIDANRLKAGTVIANNITFTGVLSGATGTFSGSVNVGIAGSTTNNTKLDSTSLEIKSTGYKSHVSNQEITMENLTGTYLYSTRIFNNTIGFEVSQPSNSTAASDFRIRLTAGSPTSAYLVIDSQNSLQLTAGVTNVHEFATLAGEWRFRMREVESFRHKLLQSPKSQMKFLNSTSTYIQFRNADDTGFVDIQAGNVAIASLRSYKKNIEPYEIDALHEIRTTPVHRYHLIDESDNEVKHIGLIYDEIPADMANISGEGVELYAMTSMLWKALQQADEKMTILESQVNQLSEALLNAS